MRIIHIFGLVFAILISHQAYGSKDKVIYYFGKETRTSLLGDKEVAEDILLQKSLLPGKNLITETACVKNGSDPALKSPVYMSVSGTHILEISENEQFTPGVLSGTGELEGKLWNWNYLKFSMNYKTPRGTARIEDENWVSKSMLVAVKELFWRDNVSGIETKTSMIVAKLRKIKRTEYEQKLLEMGCQ
jgi:hypothetical protein